MLDESTSPLQFPPAAYQSPSCAKVCPNASCVLDSAYLMAIEALNPDAGASGPDGGERMLQCPYYPNLVNVSCIIQCTGRLTAGYAPLESTGAPTDGERFAAMAYLEAVSVHAFARLERELLVHGATPALLRDARRARRDEVRHTAMTARLARVRGACARLPDAPPPAAARSLFEVALENAVEGCVRETYGALAGLVEAQTAADGPLARALRSIAGDECRHAELAWAVHAWAAPRLSTDERRRVQDAMREAVAEIAARDPRGAAILFASGPTAVG
jgi:hypothetical protein